MSAETYRGFASADPALVAGDLATAAFTVKRDGREVLSRPAPGDPADGRAWGGMLAELMAGSIDASPALQQTDRQALIREAMTATTKQLDRNSRYADPDEARDNRFQRDGGGGIGITVERTDDKKILIRAVQDGSPSAKAGVQVGDQILAIDGESMIDRTLGDVVASLRGSVGAPVALTVLRASQGAELALSMKRSRIIPTTVTYERRGDVALIHLTGFNSATTDNLQGRHRQGARRDRQGHGRRHHRHALQPRRPARPGADGVGAVHQRRHHLLDPGPPSRQPPHLQELDRPQGGRHCRSSC